MSHNRRQLARHRSRHGQWGDRVSLAFYTAMSAFTIASCVAAFFDLPSNPERWWITQTELIALGTGAMSTLPSLLLLVFYLLDADIRAFVDRFRSTRLLRSAIALLLPSGVGWLAYGVALLHSPSLWNRVIFCLLLGASLASVVLIVIALYFGYFERKSLTSD